MSTTNVSTIQRLSVVDQSPVVEGTTSAQAILDTLRLVERCEAWGYHRYWFAEHHGSASFAGAAPLTMMAAAAARTRTIRLGSGGVLVGHHRPLAVAEAVRVVQAVAPGRVDVGMGRAPGGDGRVVRAMEARPDVAEERMREVLGYVDDRRAASNDGAIVAVPDGAERPEAWVLGTSAASAEVAGRLGLPYAYGAFIDPTQMDQALGVYHRDFVPSKWCAVPTTMVATVVICADTQAEAEALAACSERWFVESFLRGKNVRFPEGATMHDVSPHEQMLVGLRRRTVVIGDADACAEQLDRLGRRYATQEVAVVTIVERSEDRFRSYELLAQRLLS
jgi:luciferase family oxidoreductase group 1